jgi:pimeloyl-ACP methyl ester carboxylesterase
LQSAHPHFARIAPATVAGTITVVFVLCCLATSQAAAPWQYGLRPGDHLVYHYTFRRQTHGEKKKDQGNDEETEVEAQFRTHVLVLGKSGDDISLGFQRNRESAELIEFRSHGKDQLAKEKVDFQKRMHTRPSHFSEAMEISSAGEPRYPWEFARETYSHLIAALHEVMSLPPLQVTKGKTWPGELRGLEFRWIDDDSVHGKLCHRIEGALPDGSLKLSYWWSPESGVLEQITYEANYSDDSAVHETARMELVSRTRDEALESWLASSDTRQGALEAILQTPNLPITGDQLIPVLESDDPASEALALAIISRRKLELSPTILGKLRESASTGVPNQLLQSELQLLADSSSNKQAPQVDECRHAFPGKPSPVKFGTLYEVTSAAEFATPATKDASPISYLLRIPPSYREDRPSPLLVVLSGGAGFALDGMYTARDVISQTDYLVLYPQAAGYWWTPEIARRFDTVFRSVLQRYNVDRDRIFITGFSNGGTGALFYATLWPQRFAAVVTLMGAGVCNEQVKAGLANGRNLPLLLIHGENDPIITPDCSTTTQAALSDLHPAIEPELKILPKHAHDITLQSDDGLTLSFFKNKLRNPFPRIVDLSESDPLATRAYWIEILDGKPGKSDIDARVKPDNTIDIHSHEVKSIRLHLRPELLPKSGDVRIVWNGKKMFTGPLRDYCSLPPGSLPPGSTAPGSTGDPKLDLADTRDLTLP